MGQFDFSQFAQLSPLETVMKAWITSAAAEFGPSEQTADGLRRLFRLLPDARFVQDLTRTNTNDPASLAQYAAEFGLEGASPGDLTWAVNYVHRLYAYFTQGEIFDQFFSSYTFIPPAASISSPFSSSFDLRVYSHARYLPIHPHSHDFFELVILVRGTCRHMVGGDYLTMHTGDLVVVPPNTVHWMIADDDESVIYNMQIRKSSFEKNFMELLSQQSILGDFFRRTLYEKEDTRSYLRIRTGDYFLGDNLLSDLLAELSLPGAYQATILNTLCKLFFLRILDRFSDKIDTSGITAEQGVVVDLMRYIQDRSGNVTKEELCRQFSYSPRQITRLISRYTGSTLRDLRRDLRIKLAARLLRETTLPIEEIASSCGYQNNTHFYDAFKESYHTTPLLYRRDIAAAALEQGALRVDTGYALGRVRL